MTLLFYEQVHARRLGLKPPEHEVDLIERDRPHSGGTYGRPAVDAFIHGPCPHCAHVARPGDRCVHQLRAYSAAMGDEGIECRDCCEPWDLRGPHDCGHGRAHPLMDPPMRRGAR